MEAIGRRSEGINTVLAFTLIPLSGFATDIYIPSLPSMAEGLGTTSAAAQLTLVFFLVSYGLSQLFVGSLLDSFGRFRLCVASLVLFSLASFAIALSGSIYLVYAMRIVQGITVSIILVGKRAYFADVYTGDKLKQYTSLFSIVWSGAPIIAPFLGGYFQTAFGWESNFYFLGIFALVMAVLETVFGRESLEAFHPFRLKPVMGVYRSMIKTADFSLGLIILGLAYAMVMVYGMASPFIIEHTFHYSAVVTGYCALLSGIALMAGGILARSLFRTPLYKKAFIAFGLQTGVALLMVITPEKLSGLYSLMGFVFIIHLLSGFVFNMFFAHSLSRFPRNAGIASGITGGGVYMVTSVFSYGILGVIDIQDQRMLGISYAILILLMGAFLVMARRAGS